MTQKNEYNSLTENKIPPLTKVLAKAGRDD